MLMLASLWRMGVASFVERLRSPPRLVTAAVVRVAASYDRVTADEMSMRPARETFTPEHR